MAAPARVFLLIAIMAGCASAGSPAPDLASLEYADELAIDPLAMSRTSSGILVEDRIEGVGSEADRNDRVDVRYTAYFPDGRILDTNLLGDGEPLRFRLGTREVVRGWDEGIPGMQEGGVRVMVVPSALAYGRQGIPGTVPADQVLVFEIQLVAVNP